MKRSLLRRLSLFIVGSCAASAALAQTDLLPDIIVRQADLYDNDIINSGGQRLLRLSNGTPNIGAGKLYLYGGATYPDNTQDVWQRIYRTDNTSWDRLCGKFVYHPTHGHIHFEGWAQYSLRQYLTGGGVGPIVAQGSKTSFCILDLQVYDSSLPGFPSGGQFRSCGTTVQGLSVGWMDIYSKTLDGQYIDITGVPDGQYWLESTVDPDNHVLESNDSNNTSRIIVNLSSGGTISPDPYEPNDSTAQVDGRPIGKVNSPNLGPCNAQKVIDGLTIHTSGNNDYFKFYIPATGTASDFVRIEFTHSAGDVDMKLLNSAGSTLATSQGTTNSEQISLSGRAAGWYYVQIYGFNGATSPNIRLTIDPPANGAPSITVVNPPVGDVQLTHGFETYTATWTKSDPENNETWVTVYMNTTPALNGSEILLPDSLNTPGNTGFHIINSAYVPEGTYWVYCQITDGGTTTGDWSSGTVTFIEPCLAPCDVNCDGSVNPFDIQPFINLMSPTPPAPCSPCAGDANHDGTVNPFDINAFVVCLT